MGEGLLFFFDLPVSLFCRAGVEVVEAADFSCCRSYHHPIEFNVLGLVAVVVDFGAGEERYHEQQLSGAVAAEVEVTDSCLSRSWLTPLKSFKTTKSHCHNDT